MMMPRPHEDRERHTAVDHRAGGPTIVFAPASWWAIAVAHVAAARVDAGTGAYETLSQKARTSAAKVQEAIVLRSDDRRRVIALLHLDGHEAFRHLSAAWDDHHLFAERRAVAESHSLLLYRLEATEGEFVIDPASTDAYAFEQASSNREQNRAVAAPAPTPGLRGVSLFSADDDRAAIIVYRFARARDMEAFGATRDTFYPVQIVRTFT